MNRIKKTLSICIAVVIAASILITSAITAAGTSTLKSMLPLEEKEAYLMLMGYTTEQLKSVTLGEILDNLTDLDGSSLNVTSGTTTVWKYALGDTGVEKYVYYSVSDTDSVVDLSSDAAHSDNDSFFEIELIVGSGAQLNSGNIRYIITVYRTEDLTEDEISFEIYAENSSAGRTKFDFPNPEPTNLSDEGATFETYQYLLEEEFRFGGTTGNKVYIGMHSELADSDPRVTAVVKALQIDADGSDALADVTDTILNVDMSDMGAGYEITENDVQEKRVSLLLTIEYYLNGEEYGGKNLMVIIDGGHVVYEGEVYSGGSGIVDAQKTAVEVISSDTEVEHYTFSNVLMPGYSASAEYEFALNVTLGSESISNEVEKAVVGAYTSLDAAESLTDIKSALLGSGYTADYSGDGVTFTVFFAEDGTLYQSGKVCAQFTVKAEENEWEWKDYTEEPIVGEADPWFRVTGVQQSGSDTDLDTYIVENGQKINMDTYYGIGYQTVFINDEDAELEQLKVEFTTADSDRVVVYANNNRFESGDVLDCSSGTVQFSVTIDGTSTRNYWVSFVKKTSDAQLYVYGSTTTREVYLIDHFDEKHDILIANIGGEALTGLKVTLDATGCALDDYWSIEDNDTLSGFTATSSDTENGILANLAKIRLVPDGSDNDINGTLTIEADGIEPIVITLTGTAKNPELTGSSIDPAVKYVPYQIIISNDNKYADFVSTTYEIIDGGLPDGLSLNTSTGVIEGVPQTAGTYTFTVQAVYTSTSEDFILDFDPSEATYTLVVNENTNENVFNASDEGYEILTYVGEEAAEYEYVLTAYEDTEFKSAGPFDEFQRLWLNGEELEKDVDYTAEEGSTKITISAKTFEEKANATGTNTLAAEFDNDGTLKRTSQNFTISISTDTSTDNNSSSSTTSSDNTSSNSTSSNSTSSNSTSSDSTSSNSTSSNSTSSGSSSSSSSFSSSTSTVDFVAVIVDADGNAISNLSLELHSTVQSAVTDSSGEASFSDVEFGSHTLSVVDGDDTLASKDITFKSGSSLSLSGSTVTAAAGSTFSLTVQYDGGELTLLSAKLVSAPTTGDMTATQVWVVLLVLSGLTAAAVLAMKNKRGLN